MSRRAAKVDTNHSTVRDGLRALGWAVEDFSHVGDGVPDLHVSIGTALAFWPPRRARGVVTDGFACWVEVKSPGGELTEAQQEWAFRNRAPLVVGETVEEIAAAIGELRRGRGGRR